VLEEAAASLKTGSASSIYQRIRSLTCLLGVEENPLVIYPPIVKRISFQGGE
jgi:hypothetical protein